MSAKPVLYATPAEMREAADTFVAGLGPFGRKHLAANLENVMPSSDALFAILAALRRHRSPD